MAQAWALLRPHGGGYYAAIRRAGEAIEIPPAFDDLPRDVRLPVAAVEDAFIDANPDLTPNGITVTCDGRALREVRICLTRDLQPRDCAADARRDCRAPALLMEQVR